MANTIFIDKETRIEADWCQDMNDFKYDLFDGATTKQAAADAINAVTVTGQTDGQVPTWDAGLGQWVPETPTGGGGVTSPLDLFENVNGNPRINFWDQTSTNYATIEFDVGINQILFSLNGGVPLFSFDMTTGTAEADDWIANP